MQLSDASQFKLERAFYKFLTYVYKSCVAEVRKSFPSSTFIYLAEVINFLNRFCIHFLNREDLTLLLTEMLFFSR